MKGLRSGHCEGRCIKRTFDDFDKSEDDRNNGARDRESRSKAKYNKKDNNRAANIEAMIEGKRRVKTKEK